MSVEPGFGGQKFMPSALDKLRWLKAEREARGLSYLLEVDGGVDAATAPLCVEAGADVLVAGSAVFGAADPAAAVGALASLVDIYLVLCVVWALIVITGGNLTMLNDTVMSGSLYYKVFNVFNPFV